MKTIQDTLVSLFLENPKATDEEVTKAVLASHDSTYTEKRVQTDRNKYNKAAFKCQDGLIPEVLATNPEKKARKRATKMDHRSALSLLRFAKREGLLTVGQ